MRSYIFIIAFIPFLLFYPSAHAETYDPLAPKTRIHNVIDLAVTDTDRGRTIPLRIYLPELSRSAPVILFSHGLGGSREGASYLGKHWAQQGYVAVFLQHSGSDSSVWQNVPRRNIRKAMKQAASGENFRLRVEDVPVVLDELARWTMKNGHELDGRLDMKSVGIAGHSFGARTVQAVSGQTFGAAGQIFTDERILAALPMSPSVPERADSPESVFGAVNIPWLLMTGTEDDSPLTGTTAEDRLDVFPALSGSDSYQLVLNGAEHLAFSDRDVRASNARNPNHHEAIKAISTAFLDAYLKKDSRAADWLANEVRSVLDTEDLWQMK